MSERDCGLVVIRVSVVLEVLGSRLPKEVNILGFNGQVTSSISRIGSVFEDTHRGRVYVCVFI